MFPVPQHHKRLKGWTRNQLGGEETMQNAWAPCLEAQSWGQPLCGAFPSPLLCLKTILQGPPLLPTALPLFLSQSRTSFVPGQQRWFCNPPCRSLCSPHFAQHPMRTQPGKEGRTDVGMNTSSVTAAASDAFSHTTSKISILFSPTDAHYTCAQADHTISFPSDH